MPIAIDDAGLENAVSVPDDPTGRLHGAITLLGEGNSVSMGSGCTSANVLISGGNGNVIRIGSRCQLGFLTFHASSDCSIAIGNGVGFNGRIRLLAHEPATLSIGNGCLFAGDVDVTVSDMHSIIDVASGRRINHARDVVIEDRVWVGLGVLILKGVRIGSDSIVGAGSVVTKDVPPGCIVAGNPARVVRTGVRWTHQLV